MRKKKTRTMNVMLWIFEIVGLVVFSGKNKIIVARLQLVLTRLHNQVAHSNLDVLEINFAARQV